MLGPEVTHLDIGGQKVSYIEDYSHVKIDYTQTRTILQKLAQIPKSELGRFCFDRSFNLLPLQSASLTHYEKDSIAIAYEIFRDALSCDGFAILRDPEAREHLPMAVRRMKALKKSLRLLFRIDSFRFEILAQLPPLESGFDHEFASRFFSKYTRVHKKEIYEYLLKNFSYTAKRDPASEKKYIRELHTLATFWNSDKEDYGSLDFIFLELVSVKNETIRTELMRCLVKSPHDLKLNERHIDVAFVLKFLALAKKERNSKTMASCYEWLSKKIFIINLKEVVPIEEEDLLNLVKQMPAEKEVQLDLHLLQFPCLTIVGLRAILEKQPNIHIHQFPLDHESHLSDVTFTMNPDSGSQSESLSCVQKIYMNSDLLKSRSEYFKAYFTGNFLPGSYEIELDAGDFKFFKRWLPAICGNFSRESLNYIDTLETDYFKICLLELAAAKLYLFEKFFIGLDSIVNYLPHDPYKKTTPQIIQSRKDDFVKWLDSPDCTEEELLKIQTVRDSEFYKKMEIEQLLKSKAEKNGKPIVVT